MQMQQRAQDAAVRDDDGRRVERLEARQRAGREHGVAFAVRRHETPFVALARQREVREALADLGQREPLPVAVADLAQRRIERELTRRAGRPRRAGCAWSRPSARAARRPAATRARRGCRSRRGRCAPPAAGRGRSAECRADPGSGLAVPVGLAVTDEDERRTVSHRAAGKRRSLQNIRRRGRSIRRRAPCGRRARASGRRWRRDGHSASPAASGWRSVRATSASSASGRSGAEGRESGGGRAADAGIAVDHERRRAIPAADEIEQLADMLVRRADHAVGRLADVVDREEEVIRRGDGRRARHQRLVVHQRHDVARAGSLDGLGEPRQGTDVDGAHALR